MPKKILIIEDDIITSRNISMYLTNQGFECRQALNATTALELVRKYSPDLIILDVLLPDGNGLQLCNVLRQETDTLILFLSCCEEEQDKIRGLAAGGDDYITKPFSLAELAARIKAFFRRQGIAYEIHPSNRILEFPGLTIDLAKSMALVNESRLDLTAKEFQLLARLARNPGWTYSSEQLFQFVWGTDAIDTRTLTVHINRLRKKLGQVSNGREYIVTVWGTGYKFNDEL